MIGGHVIVYIAEFSNRCFPKLDGAWLDHICAAMIDDSQV